MVDPRRPAGSVEDDWMTKDKNTTDRVHGLFYLKKRIFEAPWQRLQTKPFDRKGVWTLGAERAPNKFTLAVVDPYINHDGVNASLPSWGRPSCSVGYFWVSSFSTGKIGLVFSGLVRGDVGICNLVKAQSFNEALPPHKAEAAACGTVAIFGRRLEAFTFKE